MAPVVTAAGPAPVDANGGALATLTGSFYPDRVYRVYVGANDAGTPCYGSLQGLGDLCVPSSTTQMTFALPQVPPGDVPLYVVDTTDGTGVHVTGLLTTEAPFLYSMVYALRRNVRNTLRVGETDPGQLPNAQLSPGYVP